MWVFGAYVKHLTAVGLQSRNISDCNMLVCIFTLSLLHTSSFYVSLLSLSTHSFCPICGPVFGGKGVRFTTSEDVYPDKGMWHSGSEPEISRTTRKSSDQSPTLAPPSTSLPMCILKPPPPRACSNSSQQTSALHTLSILLFIAHTHMPTTSYSQHGLYAFMHVMYTLMSVCMELR